MTKDTRAVCKKAMNRSSPARAPDPDTRMGARHDAGDDDDDDEARDAEGADAVAATASSGKRLSPKTSILAQPPRPETPAPSARATRLAT